MTIDNGTYRQWIERFDSFDAGDLRAATEYGRSLSPRPRFDVVMPVHDPPEAFLEEAIASIRAQTYDSWRLCIVDDASKRDVVHRVLDRAAAEDARIQVLYSETQGGIAGATNLALGLGSAEFVVFFDHDDVLPPHALVTVADWLVREPATNLLYSDFDFIDESGARTNPFFKPDYDYDFHLGLNVISSLTVYRRTLLTELEGFRDGFGGSEDYDLSLRAVEAIDERTITHIPHVLYHWRIVETSITRTKIASAVDAARRAVSEHCTRRGVPSSVTGTNRSFIWNRVRAVPACPFRVAVAIAGPCEAVRQEARDRLHAQTAYDDFSFADLDAEEPFIGSYRNAVLRRAETALVAFIDSQLFPRDAEWLREMVSHFARACTGAVGARILAPDGTVQQSGVVLGVGQPWRSGDVSLAGAFAGIADAEANYFGRAEIAHRVAAVSGGVIVVRKSAVNQIGGFDESIADPMLVDIDLCLRLRAAGFSVVLCPYAVFDSGQGARPEPAASAAGFRVPSGSVLSDPYYNPNLSGAAADFSLAFPPRVRFPWRGAPPKEGHEL